ncbi:MAG: hypothetical protein CL878_11040 [Dehalococcoidia bacterium]|nr:hypothetical protein [Dehalococcoidia bacterium]
MPTEQDAPARTTRFSDVCGTTDELKRLLYEEPERIAADPAILRELVTDQLYMLDRMELRLREYQQLRAEVERLHRTLEDIDPPRRPEADQAAAALGPLLEDGQPLGNEESTAIVRYAERIRSVAGHLEQVLRAHMDVALALTESYERARGGRPWPAPGAATEPELPTEQAVPSTWEAWLPREPHRARLVDFLNRSRAYVIWPDSRGEQPLVQFEDGGLMPMSEVRWSDAVRNFYPASQGEPQAQAREYRRAS